MPGNLSSDAMQYEGSGYVFGGAPEHGRGQWDCSSFVNWCAGNDLGMAIPGFAAGSYHGQVHGPVVLDWASWTGCTTIPGSAAAAGDIVVWPGIGPTGHMGIVTGPNQMISALNPSKGTQKTAIKGFGIPGIPAVYRHINGASTTALTSAISDPLSGCASLIPGIGMIFMFMAWRQRRHDMGMAGNRLRPGFRHIRSNSGRLRDHRVT
jgi:cell wall-associated NlpC family hydrolase